jgi:hypothetical protein
MSSFARAHFHGAGSDLRKGYTFQYLDVEDDRARALLESCAIWWLCPQHLGLGAGKPRADERRERL